MENRKTRQDGHFVLLKDNLFKRHGWPTGLMIRTLPRDVGKAMSISETWYAIKDHGTNYCNLYNLMEGSGLTEVRGYKEVTSDFLCTQRSSANCIVY
ncbi:hypothetical protein PAMA_008867 [Pampus argenteus]